MAAHTKVSGSSGQGLKIPHKLVVSTAPAPYGAISPDLWTVPELFLSYGRNPSTATIEIPLAGLDPDVIMNMLHGERVVISALIGGYGIPKLNASISRDSSFVSPQNKSLCIQVSDDRIYLNNYKVIGAVVLKEDGTNYAYQLSVPSLFNPGGMRNKGRTDSGHIVITAYQEWGVNNSDSKKKAEHFSLADIFEYYRQWFTGDYASEFKAHYAFFNAVAIPDTLIWAPGLASGIDSVNWNGQAFQQGNASTGGGRHGREFSIDGLGLLDNLEALLAGTGYSYTLEPAENNKSELVLVPLRPSQSEGVAVVTDDPTVGPNAIQFERNSEDTLTQATVLGLPVEVETRVSQKDE